MNVKGIVVFNKMVVQVRATRARKMEDEIRKKGRYSALMVSLSEWTSISGSKNIEKQH